MRRLFEYLESTLNCHLVVLAVEVGAPSPQASSASLRGCELLERTLPFDRLCVRPMCLVGAASSPSRTALAGLSSLDTVASAVGELAVHEVLQDERWLHAPAPSRVPART